MSVAHLAALLGALRQGNEAKPGSMVRCPVSFNGTRKLSTVEDFTTRAELYRHVEHIFKADALAGFQLLLSGKAQTRWRGVSASIATWNDALTRIHDSFAPKRANHELY